MWFTKQPSKFNQNIFFPTMSKIITLIFLEIASKYFNGSGSRKWKWKRLLSTAFASSQKGLSQCFQINSLGCGKKFFTPISPNPPSAPPFLALKSAVQFHVEMLTFLLKKLVTQCRGGGKRECKSKLYSLIPMDKIFRQNKNCPQKGALEFSGAWGIK